MSAEGNGQRPRAAATELTAKLEKAIRGLMVDAAQSGASTVGAKANDPE
jgi:hypothetical protein